MFEVEYHKSADALLVTIAEDLSLDLYRRVMAAILSHPVFRPGINVIYDIRQVSGLTLTSHEIRHVADYAKTLAPRRGESWKAAIVVSGTLAFGLARMFEIMSNGAPFTVRVFRSMEDAITWLSSGE